MNCLIGPGDSGKTSVLDAIDLCIGTRRTAQFSDVDFHNLDIEKPITIAVTIGELPDPLRSMEPFANFLRGYDASTETVEDEPKEDWETVLTVLLTISSDLEPAWSLYSFRAEALGLTRSLSWADRLQIAPIRIGGSGDLNLGWRRGSVLNRLTDEKADASAALIKAARDARAAFGDQAEAQLTETLSLVSKVAADLGIVLEDSIVRALLDAQSVSFSGGTVSLHDKQGIPLRAMGVGSARLLIAGLQKRAAPETGITLVDELEHGLEPHRIIRLLGSLGAKEKDSPLQVFATTHSPVTVRELAAPQLNVVRHHLGHHHVVQVRSAMDVQGTIRAYPEAFLASSVLVCEGASEVGLLRGLDLYLTRKDLAPSLTARGVALVDAGGVNKLYGRVQAFVALGYRTLAFRDDDAQPSASDEAQFVAGGGKLVMWRPGRALEDELFIGLPDAAINELIERAGEILGEPVINDQIKSASSNAFSLHDRPSLLTGPGRLALAKASKSKQNWFKSVSRMEEVAADIIGPHLHLAEESFRGIIDDLFGWMG